MKNPSDDAVSRHEEEAFAHVLNLAIREYAQQLLQMALEIEAVLFVEENSGLIDSDGRRRIVRHGYIPARSVRTGIGSLTIRQPRVKDRAYRLQFSSSILRRYVRAIPSSDVSPLLLFMRRSIQSNVFPALRSILGNRLPSLSPQLIARLATQWRREHHDWSGRNLSEQAYTRLWAGALNINDNSNGRTQSLLVLIGETAAGAHEILGTAEGAAHSRQAWRELVRDIKNRGMISSPTIVHGNRTLGVWAAFARVFPSELRPSP